MRRRKMWSPFIGVAVVLAATENISGNLLANSPLTGSNSSSTVLRVVGTLYAESNVDGQTTRVPVGLGVFNDNATPLTTPDPTTDPYEWLWWKLLQTDGRTTESASGVFSEWNRQFDFDVRSMRILKPNQSLVLKFGGAVGGTMNITFGLRTLVALP